MIIKITILYNPPKSRTSFETAIQDVIVLLVKKRILTELHDASLLSVTVDKEAVNEK